MIRMDTNSLISSLVRSQTEIMQKLRFGGHFEDYRFIQEAFRQRNIGTEFQKRFCRFYVLDGAGGMAVAQKEEFFALLSAGENDLLTILRTLYEVPGYGNRHRLFLSFASKLLHTLDTSLPIYDTNVASVLGLKKPTYTGNIEDRIRDRVAIYNELREKFGVLLSHPAIWAYLEEVRRTLGLFPDVSDAKVLDSLLWALYVVTKKEKGALKN